MFSVFLSSMFIVCLLAIGHVYVATRMSSHIGGPFRQTCLAALFRPQLPTPERLGLNGRSANSALADPLENNHKVWGQFHSHIDDDDIKAAARLMDFRKLSSLFHEVGVAPNATDQKCALWMSERSLAPLVALLRSSLQKDNAVKVMSYCTEFTSVARQPFDIMQPLRDAIALLDSLRLVCSLTVGSQAMHKPSIVRDALDYIGNLDKNSAVGLAFQHGDLAKYLRSTGERFVTISANDVVAQQRLLSAHDLLKGEVKAHGESVDLGCAALLDIAQGINSLTAASMEQMTPVLDGIFGFVSLRVQHGERLTFDCADQEFVDLALEVVKQLRARQSESANAANKPGESDFEQQAKAKTSLFPVYLEDSLVEKFVPCLLNALNNFEQCVASLMDFMQAAGKMMEKVRVALLGSGVQAEFVNCKARDTHMQERCDIMREIMEVLSCSMCFSSEVSRQDFKGVLAEWGAWQHTSQDCRRRDPRSRPALDLILKGAQSSTNLEVLLKSHGGIGKERVDGLVLAIKASGVLDNFAQASASLIGDALVQVHGCSFLEAVMPQDLRTISKVTNFEYALNIAKLLIGSQRPQGDDGWKAAFNIAMAMPDNSELNTNDLPHHKPIDLAKNCINLLAAESEVSCSGACRKHECVCLGCGDGVFPISPWWHWPRVGLWGSRMLPSSSALSPSAFPVYSTLGGHSLVVRGALTQG